MIVLPEVAVAVDDLTKKIEEYCDKTTFIASMDNNSEHFEIEEESRIKIKEKNKFNKESYENADSMSLLQYPEVEKEYFPASDDNSIDDSPIKLKRKKCKNILEDDEESSHLNANVENVNTPKDLGTVLNSIENNAPSTETPIDGSPIKIKRKKSKNLFEDDDLSFSNTNVEVYNTDMQQNFDPTTGELRNQEENKEFLNESESKDEPNEYSVNENIDYEDSEDEERDDKIPIDDDVSFKKDKKSYLRELKGKELMKQSLSLPYFQLPKPDFKQYINETDKRLSKIVLDITPGAHKVTKSKIDPVELFQKRVADRIRKIENSKSNEETITLDLDRMSNSEMVALKPVSNIVFEIGTSKIDPVELFRKKVIDKMRRNESLKLKTDTKANKESHKNFSDNIGAERMSWKMKLLNEIAKKKEEALKKKNEIMLEEELEEENQSIIESDSEEIMEDDAVDVDLTNIDSIKNAPTQTNNFNVSFSEISKGVHQDNSGTIFDDSSNKHWEEEKDIESSPFCFSLPSFQPGGGFHKSADASSLNISYSSQTNLSINDSVSQREMFNRSELNISNLENNNPLPSISQNDEKVYDKVLVKENLLAHDRNISQEMTADILDICSGQFIDEEDVPKTPPLMNMSADEDSEVEEGDNSYLSEYPKTLPLKNMSADNDSMIADHETNCPIDYPDTASNSDSDDEDLSFKRKVLKKRIRPISPIDEESRHGEEDTQVRPSSELLVPNTNFDFSKKIPSPIEKNFDSEDLNTLVYNSDESLTSELDNPTKKISEQTKTVLDYFDEEAELSGEEGSSDEDERELDEEEALLIDNNPLEEEELKDQIGTLHLKHLLDDDDQMIRKVKNHFLDEGELYSDAARQRKFNWTINQTDAIDKAHQPDSDNEDDMNDSPFQQDKLKWMQDKVNDDVVEEVEPLDTTLKTGVRKRISAQIVVEGMTRSANKRPRNSFLEEDESKKSFKKIKLDVFNAQGRSVTKNFVFVETNNQSEKKKLTVTKNLVDNSVFDLMI